VKEEETQTLFTGARTSLTSIQTDADGRSRATARYRQREERIPILRETAAPAPARPTPRPCLWLKQMDTELFSELMLFESHLAERDEDPEVEERVRAVANVVVNELRIDGVSMQDVRLICGILDVNSFEITTAQGESSSIQAVYRSSSLAEHRCVPNLHRTFEISTLEICLRAMQPITAGTHLTITYTDSLWPTRDRRLHLKFSKYFDCSCRRCSDPTELGTFLSSIKCPKCPIGFIQSDDPLEDDSHWTCESCIASFPPSFPERVNEEVSTTVNIMERAGAGVEQCERFLLVQSRILHPQHALMIDVSHTLLHTLGHSDGYLMNTLSDRQLQTREDIARRLLRIASKLLPGMSRLKGTTLYELFLTHQQRALRWEQSGTRSWRDILASFAAGRDCLELCLSCLKFESEQSAEGNLAATASEDLKLLLEYMSRVKQLNTTLPRN